MTVERTTGPTTVTCEFEEVMVEEMKLDEGPVVGKGAIADDEVQSGVEELKL